MRYLILLSIFLAGCASGPTTAQNVADAAVTGVSKASMETEEARKDTATVKQHIQSSKTKAQRIQELADQLLND